MWTHEESIETFASPARVWRILSDVPRWREWNAGIETIEIHGAFAAGTVFTMKPPGQEALRSTLLDVRPDEGFTDVTVVDEVRVVVSHRLLPLASGGTRIVYRTEVTGPGAAEIGPLVTGDFPQVLAALRALAERR